MPERNFVTACQSEKPPHFCILPKGHDLRPWENSHHRCRCNYEWLTDEWKSNRKPSPSVEPLARKRLIELE